MTRTRCRGRLSGPPRRPLDMMLPVSSMQYVLCDLAKFLLSLFCNGARRLFASQMLNWIYLRDQAQARCVQRDCMRWTSYIIHANNTHTTVHWCEHILRAYVHVLDTRSNSSMCVFICLFTATRVLRSHLTSCPCQRSNQVSPKWLKWNLQTAWGVSYESKRVAWCGISIYVLGAAVF